MLLSTAIREGKVGISQGFIALVNDTGDKACALGCAGRRIGLWKIESDTYISKLGKSPYDILNDKFPILKVKFNHPAKDALPLNLGSIIVSLNDSFKWSIRKISQFVRQCEKEQGL